MAVTSTLWASGTPTTTGTTWSGATSATGANNGTYATWVNATTGDVGYINLTGYGIQAAIGSQPNSINSVAVTTYAWRSHATRIASVAVQLLDGTTPIGSAQNMAASTTVGNSETLTFTGVTWAQLANLGVRVTATRGANTNSTTFTIDAAGLVVDYTPAVINGTFSATTVGSATAAGNSGYVYGTHVTDSFTRGNSATTMGVAETGQPWTADNGVWGITSNRAYMVSETHTPEDLGAYSLVEVGSTTMTVSAKIWGQSISQSYPGIAGRFESTSNFYLGYWDFSNSKITAFWRTTTWDAIQIESGTTTFADGDTLTLDIYEEATGTRVRVLHNGTVKCNVLHTNPSRPMGTKAGLRDDFDIAFSGPGATFDDFEAVRNPVVDGTFAATGQGTATAAGNQGSFSNATPATFAATTFGASAAAGNIGLLRSSNPSTEGMGQGAYVFRVISGSNEYELPDYVEAKLGYEFSDTGALTLQYLKGGVNHDRLVDNAILALRYNGIEQPNSRWRILAGSDDEVAENKIETFTGLSLFDIFRRVVVVPAGGAASVSFSAASPGAILDNLFDAAQARGAMTGITWDFTGSLTSAATAWAKVITIEYKAGVKYLDLIRDMVTKGLIEAQFRGYEFEVYNADGLGSTTAVELRAGQDYTELPRKWSSENRINFSLAVGDENTIVSRSDGTIPDGPFGHEEGAVSQGGTKDTGTLTIVNDAAIAKYRETREQLTRNVIIRPNGPIPLIDYGVADYIRERATSYVGASVRTTSESYRVRSLVVVVDSKGLVGTAALTLNDKFLEDQVRLARKVEGIIGGPTGEGGGNGVPTDPVDVTPDTTVPNPPTGIVFSYTAYLDGAGRPRAYMLISWAAPTQNTDNTQLTDLKDYEVQYRRSTVTDWTTVTTTNTHYVVSNLDPGATFYIRVRARDTAETQHFSTWAPSDAGQLSNAMPSDATPPSIPSQLTGEITLTVPTLIWNGLNDSGGGMEADFAYCWLHRSQTSNFTPSAASRIGQMFGRGAYTAAEQAYGVEWFYKLTAVDTSGNESAGNVQMSLIATKLANTDLAQDIIDSIQQAIDDAAAAQSDATVALTAANGKNRVVHSTSDPSGGTAEGYITNDIWWKYDANDILLGQWRFNGSTWVPETIANAILASGIDASKITVGFLSANRIDANALSIGQVNGLQTALNSKVRTWVQDGIPTSTGIGEIWVDSNDNNRTYVARIVGADQITAGEWELFQTTGVRTFVQSAIPTSISAGDLWVDTTAGQNNTMYIAGMVGANEKIAGEWVAYTDPRTASNASSITTIQGDLTTLSGRVDGKSVVWYQTTAPGGLGTADTGDIWIDSDDPNRLTKYWDGDSWENISDQSALDALSQVSSKITTFYNATAPTATAIGDLWIDTDDNNKLYRASAVGSGNWVAVSDLRAAALMLGNMTRDPNGANKWLRTRYSGTLGVNVIPTLESLYGRAVLDRTLRTDVGSDQLSGSNIGDSYTGHLRTLIRKDSAGTISFNINHDDGASIYLDGTMVYSYNQVGNARAVSFNVPVGWHILDFLWDEGTGGDYMWPSVAIGTLVNELVAPMSNAVTTFVQSATPVAANVGDMWVNTGDSNKTYVAKSVGSDQITTGEWELFQSQSTAEFKTFTQDDAPTSLHIGDLWVDTNDNNKTYIARMVGADAVTTGEWELLQAETVNLVAGWKMSGQTTINGGQIATDTITAAAILAGAIGTSELAVADTSNMVEVNEIFPGVVTQTQGAHQIISNWSTRTDNSIAEFRLSNKTGPIPMKTGERIRFTGRLKVASGTASIIPRCFVFDAADGYAWFDLPAMSVTTTDTTFAVEGNATVGDTRLRYYWVLTGATGVALSIKDCRLYRMDAGELVVDGTITGNKLVANSITADKVVAGAITAEKLALGITRTNLVADASFEEDYTMGYWDAFGDGSIGNVNQWRRYTNTAHASKNLTSARSGHTACHINADSTGASAPTETSIITNTFQVISGKTYKVIVHATAVVNPAALALTLWSGTSAGGVDWFQSPPTITDLGGSGLTVPVAATNPPMSQDFSGYAGEFIADTNEWIAVQIKNHPASGLSGLIIDDVSVVEKGAGGASELTAAGLRLFDNEGNEAGAFVTGRPNFWSISKVSSAGDVDTIASVSDEGKADFTGLSVDEDIIVGGFPVLGTTKDWQSPHTSGGRVWGHADKLARGVIAYGEIGAQTLTGNSWRRELSFFAEPGRTYKLCFSGGNITPNTQHQYAGFYIGIATPSTPGNDAGGVTFAYKRYLYAHSSTSGGGMVTVPAGFWLARANQNGVGQGGEINYGRNRMALGFSVGTGNSSVALEEAVQYWVEDMGPDMPDTGIAASGTTGQSSATQTYTQIWTCNNSEAYTSGGSGETWTTDLVQGYYTSSNGNQKSCLLFTGNGTRSETISTAMTGATMVKAEVYLYFKHWYYNNGGTAVIRTHDYGSLSATTPDQTPITSSGWPKPGGRWVDITSLWNTSKRGVFLGPGVSTSLTYYGRAASHSDSSGKPQLRLTYRKNG